MFDLTATQEVRGLFLFFDTQREYNARLSTMVPALGSGIRARVEHGKNEQKTPQQWAWWQRKANWTAN